MMKVCLTGGIACGKSLLARYLNKLGVETLDADDVAHELIPDPAQRRRIAAEVFADPEKRRALEARLHPIIRERLLRFLDEAPPDTLRLVIVPLLFETHWDAEYDIICCIRSGEASQRARMEQRGYPREEAEARLAAQLPVAEKAAKSHYVIENDGTCEELRDKARCLITWLKEKADERSDKNE